MTNAFTFESKPSFTEMAARVIRANKGMETDRREMVERLRGRYLVIIRNAAPKKTGGFARNITASTFERGAVVGFEASTPQPLGKWLRPPGTRAHIITPKGAGYPLRFEVGGRVVFAMSVRHPGYQPQTDFVQEATNEFLPEAREGLRRISKRYVATVVS